MAKTKKSRIDEECDNYSRIGNFYLHIYINHFVKKFSNYNNNKFLVTISGLNRFIDKDDKALSYLFYQLKENNFTIKFAGNEESIKHINTTCRNITTDTFDNFQYQIQNIPSIVELSSKTNIPVIGIIIMKIIAKVINENKTLYKAIVLDLDDTLWKGTLSEVGIDKIRENMSSKQGASFIAFMKFVKILANELGIFIAICSRNNPKMVESTIKELDENIFPLKNDIDYIIANYNDKSENISKIAKQLSILPNSIVFIDDNKLVRDEVKGKLPEVFIPEWTNHDELTTQLISSCIFERIYLSQNSQKRKKQYQIIQTERTQNSLPNLSIKIINDVTHTESIKLYSKSNQFKFSQNNDKFGCNAKSLYFEICRKNGENLGICSAITYTITYNTMLIHNWAISCRYFEIGLEEFILIYIQKIANTNKIFINYQHSEYNQKVNELLVKYSDAFINNHNSDLIEVIFTNNIINYINANTNLSNL